MKLEDASWMEIDDHLKNKNGILLSMGSTEQHGPIGLIGTDTICSYEIALKAAKINKLYVAPKISYTPANFNMSFPGTISISENLFKNFIHEIISSIFSHNFKFIYIVNGHGANIEPSKQVINKFKKNKVFFKSWWDFPEVNLLRKKFFGEWEGMHATPSEISITQFNHRIINDHQLKNIAKSPPEKLSPKFLSSHAGDKHDLPKKHRKRFPDGRVGSHSIMATPEKGKVLFETAVKCISKEIKIISKEL